MTSVNFVILIVSVSYIIINLNNNLFAASQTYYISINGSDKNNGLSKSTPWNSLKNIENLRLKPGDQVLLDTRGKYYGNVYIDEKKCGNSAELPNVIGSYGDGQAQIAVNRGNGIHIENCAGFDIRDLDLRYEGNYKNSGHGILINNTLNNNIKLDNLQITNLKISGFKDGGISVVAEKVRSGYRNLKILNSEVFDNYGHGIGINGYYSTDLDGFSFENVYIAGNEVYENSGKQSIANSHTGSGIILGNTDDALIEFNTVYSNGINNIWTKGGGVGIWAWDSNNVVIQNNISHNNKTSSFDGGGFDLDGGVSNSVMQYNLSYENDGSGFQVGQFWGARPNINNTIRYNISINDGRKRKAAGIYLFRLDGVLSDIKIYNNSIIGSKSSFGDYAAFKSMDKDMLDIQVYNNIFYTIGDIYSVFIINDEKGFKFLRNNYYSDSGQSKIFYNGHQYKSVKKWAASTKNEMIGKTFSALLYNPLLALNKIFNSNLYRDDQYYINQIKLSKDSPNVDRGLNIEEMFNINPGKRDYFSNPIPHGNGYDIGAYESSN